MISTIFGIPVGLLMLTRVPEPIVKGALGLVIIAFSVQAIRAARSRAWRLATDRGAWMFGFAAGVLGGAYGMNGPPLAVYGSMRGWSPAQFRATLQGYFLPASAIVMAGYFMVGLWTPDVNWPAGRSWWLTCGSRGAAASGCRPAVSTSDGRGRRCGGLRGVDCDRRTATTNAFVISITPS